jgi:hypothetical protein
MELQSLYQLPENYGDTKIALMAVDPHLLYTYWEIGQDKLESLKENIGLRVLENSYTALRVTNISKNFSFFIRLNDFSACWYINVPDSGCVYVVEIGRKFLDDFFINFATSNHVTMPGVNISFNDATCFVNYKDASKIVNIIIPNQSQVLQLAIGKTVSSFELFKNESAKHIE